MQQAKNVCHLLSSLKIGGAERFVIDLCIEQNNNGYSAEILSFGSEDDELVQVAKKHNIHINFIRKKWWSKNSKLYTILKKFSVLHIHSPVILKAILIVTPLLKSQKIIYTRHGEGLYESMTWKLIHVFMKSYIHIVTFVSENGKKIFSDVHAWHNKKQKVIENGIPLLKNHKSPRTYNKKLKIGSVGRVVEIKQQQHLIEAWSSLPFEIKSDIEIHIIGDGDCLNKLKDQAKNCELSQNIIFYGFMNDREEIQKLFDVLVVTSESEGLSIAILEAMAEGKPVIGSNVGGNYRLIIDGVTGVLYPFGDIEKLQTSIMTYVNEHELIYVHGNNALDHVVNNFSINSAMKEYKKAYDEKY